MKIESFSLAIIALVIGTIAAPSMNINANNAEISAKPADVTIVPLRERSHMSEQELQTVCSLKRPFCCPGGPKRDVQVAEDSQATATLCTICRIKQPGFCGRGRRSRPPPPAPANAPGPLPCEPDDASCQSAPPIPPATSTSE